MIRLTTNSLTKTGRFRPETMGLNLEERNSSATMTLPIDVEQFTVGNWLQDDCNPGSGIVWRVRSIDRKYERNTQTVTLEHIINSLKDKTMFGDVDASMMSGTTGATTCTAKQAVEYILAQQNDWTLGDFAYNSVSNPYSFSSETLYDALETVSSTLEDCIWEYDFSTYPFKLHIRQLSSDVTSEMRMSRNISTLQITVDRNGMYTRFYPIGKNNLKLGNGGYVSKNELTWGIISKVEVDQSLDTAEKLTAWANIRLNKHAEPLINVTISGLDLSESTGESLDSFTIGKKCRVPLPEYSTTVTERVTKLSWQDKLNRREEVKVTLANKLADVATILKEQAAAAGGGGIAGAKNKEEDHAWFVDTTERVGMVAEAVAGSIDGHPNWSRVSELMVDGNGIDARVTVAEGELVTQEARITVTEGSISTLVTKTGINDLGQNETLNSKIIQTADAITSEVTRASAAEGTLSGAIQVEAGKVSQIVSSVGANGQVTAASIVLAINDSTGQSEAHIDADHVYIDAGSSTEKKVTVEIAGKLTAAQVDADFVNARIALIPVVTMRTVAVTGTLSCDGYVYGSNFVIGSNSSGGGNNIYLNTVYNAASLTAGSGGAYTLRLTRINGQYDEFSFNRPASVITLSSDWSGNVYTVTVEEDGVPTSVQESIELRPQLISDAGTNHMQVSASEYSGSGQYIPHGTATDLYVVLNGSGTTAKAQIRTANSASSGTAWAELNVGSLYSDGQTAAGLEYSTSAHTISRSLSSATKTYSVSMSQGNWSGGNLTVSAKIGTNVTINSTTVSIPAVTATNWVNTTGRTWRADVTIGGIARQSGTKDFGGYYTDGQTAAGLTYDTSAHTISRATTSSTKTYSISMSQGSWSSGNLLVSAKIGTNVTINSTTVSIPNITSAALNTRTSGNTWSVNVVIGGTTKTASVDCYAEYKRGWNDYRSALLDSSHSRGYTHLYYGSWYGTLYVAPTGGANPVYNCVGQATGFDIPAAKS